jgi:hypothetical protein
MEISVGVAEADKSAVGEAGSGVEGVETIVVVVGSEGTGVRT